MTSAVAERPPDEAALVGEIVGRLAYDGVRYEDIAVLYRSNMQSQVFEEQLAIMKGLWTQERVQFKGTYYTLEGRLEPKPVQKPHPPLWIGGWGDITLRRAATLADNWIPGPTADLARLLAGKRQFLERRQAAGRPTTLFVKGDVPDME